MSTFASGQIIGTFKIETLIARGGMGAVYRARDEEQDNLVALKVLHPECHQDPVNVDRFLEEGLLVSRLVHPSIVRTYRAARHGDSLFLAMEFVSGKNLGEMIEEHGPLNPWIALRILKQITSGLEYAHRQGVVHCDIKPGNIIVDDEGKAKLADFGIARSLERARSELPPGVVLGTPAYMSPEQCRGQIADHRSDLYSLGTTLYTALAGKTPYRGPSDERLLRRVVEEEPIPLEELAPRLPGTILGLVRRLMAKKPEDRFQSGSALVAAINEIFALRSEDSEKKSRLPAFLRLTPRQVLMTAVAIGALGLIGLVLRPGLRKLVDNSASAEAGSAAKVEDEQFPVPESDEDVFSDANSMGRSLSALLLRADGFRLALLHGDSATALRCVELDGAESDRDYIHELIGRFAEFEVIHDGEFELAHFNGTRARIIYSFPLVEDASDLLVTLDWERKPGKEWTLETEPSDKKGAYMPLEVVPLSPR